MYALCRSYRAFSNAVRNCEMIMSIKPYVGWSVLVMVAVLAGCATKTPAPVQDRNAPAGTATSPAAKPSAATSSAASPAPASSKPADVGKTHAVQKGDTLYSIAFQNNIDYRELAQWNNIDNPNVIKVGDVVRLTAPTVATLATASTTTAAAPQPKPGEPVVTPLVVTPQPSATAERPPANTAASKTEPRGGKLPYSDAALAKLNADAAAPTTATTTPTATAPNSPAVTPAPASVPAPVAAPPASKDSIDWVWPVKGNVITTFTELNKGIDIAGTKGTPVMAAATGTVIHTGAGIRGYGRLVIIKHGTGWVSAYAHNDKILVMEGQEVKRGQKIAEMGNSDADQVKLHFEIRRQGKPVDPVGLLPKP
jgi:lipoprotein NlpD